MTRKFYTALLLTVAAGVGFFALRTLFGLRVELTGSGTRPMFSFYKPEKHFEALEKQRAASAAVPEPAASPVAPPMPEDWTTFRGPGLLGVYAKPIETSWPSVGLKQLWRQPSGAGYASFVIARGKAYTIEQRRAREVVAAYDAASGRELWAHGWDARFEESMGGEGPRATPAWDDGRVYALGAAGELRALDADTGRPIWSKNILADNGAENITWGMSAAPLVVDGKLIVLPGGTAGKSVVAYDKLTGAPVWKALDDRQSYTSPMVVTLAGKRQLLVVSASRAMGLEIADGALLWEYPWRTEHEINSAQPIVLAPDRVFLSAGYGHGSAVIRIVPQGSAFAAQTLWENTRMKNKFSSSVLRDGYIYGFDEAILASIDAATGELKWKGGRYGYGQLLLAGDHLVVLSETGDLALVKAQPEKFEEVAQFPALDGKTWNHPAISGGRIFVRNTTEMACFHIGR
jgi:outer membrane protein assembly factor BamB